MNSFSFIKNSPRKIVLWIIIIPLFIQLLIINLVEIYVGNPIYYILFTLFGTLYLPYFYWLYSITYYLYKLPNQFFKLKIITYKYSLLLNLMIIFNFVYFVAYMFKFVFIGGLPDTSILLYFFSFQIVGILSFIYSSYFLCKLLSSIELKKETKFSDYFSYFLLLAFPPLAIWIIQDKIKKIVEDNT